MTTTRLILLTALFALGAAGCASPETPDDEAPPLVEDEEPTDDKEEPEPEDPGPEPCDDPAATKACDGVSEGSCQPGIRYCDDGFWTMCDGRVQPIEGLCDTPSCLSTPGQEVLNTGCECIVGTTRDCYEGPEGTLGVGTCRGGVQFCEATEKGSVWGECKGQVLPEREDCSGRNIDCHIEGENDPLDCSCPSGQTRPCGGVTGGTCALGTQTCTGGMWGACVGAVQPGGVCDEPSCLGGPNPGCECVVGETEECYTGPSGTAGVGTCEAGTRTCGSLGKWGSCGAQTRPLPTCDVENCTGTPHPACE